MALSKDDRKKFENDFKYLINKYIEFLSLYNELISKPELTSEEQTEFEAVQNILLSIGEVLSIAMQALGDDLFGKAVGLYYEFKEAADAGDTNAQSVLQELKPMFEASLSSRISKN